MSLGMEKDWKLVCTLSDISRAIYTVDFANQSDMFAIAGGDGVIRVYNISKKS